MTKKFPKSKDGFNISNVYEENKIQRSFGEATIRVLQDKESSLYPATVRKTKRIYLK